MRLLVVADRTPALSGPGADGSTLIPAQVLPRLGPGTEVVLAHFPDGQGALDEDVRRACRRMVALDTEPARSLGRGVRTAAARSGPGASAAVRALADEADVVLLHGLGAFGLVPAVSHRPVVVQEVDPWSLFWRDRAHEGGPRHRAAALLRSRRAAHHEREAAAVAASYLVVSTADAVDLQARLGRPVVAVVNGVRALPAARAAAPGVPGRVVFVGGLDYPPNVASARELCLEVLPLLRARVPHAHVVLVGRRPGPDVLDLRSPGVSVVSDVDDVFDELVQAEVAAFPGGYGRGVRNSVLEALRAGRPVVASSVSARSAPPGPHLMVRDDPAGAADALAGLLADPGARERATASARDAGGRLQDWAGAAQAYARVLASAAR